MFKENTYENSAEKGGQFRYTSRMTKIELKGNLGSHVIQNGRWGGENQQQVV